MLKIAQRSGGIANCCLTNILRKDPNPSQLRFSSSVQYFRTLESDPTKHEGSHVGRFYTIPPDDYTRLFGSITGGFPSTFRDQCRVFHECCLLVRSPFMDLKNCIEAYPSTFPTLKYLLYGKPGSGKTSTLCHLLHYGYLKEYVLVNITWVPIMTRFAKEYQPSTKRPGNFDHTTNAVAWLAHFRHQNATLLTKLDLKTSQDYDWTQREQTPKGSDLTELIEHGIARPVHASECIYAMIHELKLASTAGKCRTMVTIDGVNAFYYEACRIKDDRRNIVDPNKITLYEAFKQLFRSDWSGGVVTCVVDALAIKDVFRTSDLPRHLLTKQGWEDFDPFVPIPVDLYSSAEIQTTIDYYLDRKWLAHPCATSREARMELEVLSCNNPYTLMELAASR